MAQYTSLRLGSKGDKVTNLQTRLVEEGYDIAVDGSFGPETEAAVKAYQKAKGLTVDGSAGNQTQTSLYGPLTDTTSNNTTTTTTNSPLTNVQKAEQYYDDLKTQAPTYTPDITNDELKSLRESILNPTGFSYDPTTDPVYLQYAEEAQKAAKLGMEDAMGQAAALSGGFGNSYAQMVGQQVYNEKMNSVNDIIPELEQNAYNRYQDEIDIQRDNYEMLSNQEANDYDRYFSEMDIYNSNLDRAYNEMISERESEAASAQAEFEYDKWLDEMGIKERELALKEAEAESESEYDYTYSEYLKVSEYAEKHPDDTRAQAAAEAYAKGLFGAAVAEKGKNNISSASDNQKIWSSKTAIEARKAYQNGGDEGVYKYLLTLGGSDDAMDMAENIIQSIYGISFDEYMDKYVQ